MHRKHFSDWLKQDATLPRPSLYWMTLDDLYPYLGYKNRNVCSVAYHNGLLDWLPTPEVCDEKRAQGSPMLLWETVPTLRAILRGRPTPAVGHHVLAVYPPVVLEIQPNYSKPGQTVPRFLTFTEIPEDNETRSIWLDEIESEIHRLTGYVRLVDFDPPMLPKTYPLTDARKHHIHDPEAIVRRKEKAVGYAKARNEKAKAAYAIKRAARDAAAAHRALSIAALKEQ